METVRVALKQVKAPHRPFRATKGKAGKTMTTVSKMVEIAGKMPTTVNKMVKPACFGNNSEH